MMVGILIYIYVYIRHAEEGQLQGCYESIAFMPRRGHLQLSNNCRLPQNCIDPIGYQ